MHQALCLTLNMNYLLGSSKQPWHKSPMTATSQMGYWGWEWMCGGAQGCHVTAHSQAVSGPDGEHWRKTIILHKNCYLVREHNLSKSLQPWGWYCYPILQMRNMRMQGRKSTRPVLNPAYWGDKDYSQNPTLKGLWDTGKCWIYGTIYWALSASCCSKHFIRDIRNTTSKLYEVTLSVPIL